MIAFVLGILACFVAGDLLHRFGSTAEVSRKSVHVGTCLVIAAFPVFGIGDRELLLIAIGSFVAIALLRRTVLMRAIMSVERTSWGDLMLPLSVAIIAPMHVAYPVFLGAYLVLGISDALASLVGRAFGRRRYMLLGHAKSYIGSSAFFASAWAILAPVAHFGGLPPVTALLAGGIAAGALTLVEALSHKGVDNLSIPVGAALLLPPLLHIPFPV